MLCSNCGEDVPYVGNVCPHCHADKTKDKQQQDAATAGAFLGCIIGTVAGGVLGWLTMGESGWFAGLGFGFVAGGSVGFLRALNRPKQASQ